MIRLVLERPGVPPVLMAFNQPVVVVGRGGDDPAAKVDWVLPFPDVSRRQCRFSQVGERTFVEGLAPRNPIRIERREIRELTRLMPGEQIEFGYCSLRLVGEAGREEVRRPAARAADEPAVRSAMQPGPEDMSAIVGRARRWAALGQPPGLLLAGAALRRGQAWARGGADLGAAGGLVKRFVEASAGARRARLQRRALAGVAVAVALSGGSLTARGLVGGWTPEAVARTAVTRADGCRRSALARAEEASQAALREPDEVGVLLAGYALQVAERGGCGAEARAEGTLRELLAQRRGWVLGTHAAAVRAAAMRGDGRVAATADALGRVLLWSGPGATPVELAGTSGAIDRLAFSGDGRRLAAGGVTGEVLVWEVGAFPQVEGPLRPSGRLETITGLAFDASGRALAAGDRRGTLRLWDMSGEAPIEVGVQAAPGAATELVFAPGADRLYALAGGRALAFAVRAGGGGSRLTGGEVLPADATVTALAVDRRGQAITGDAAGAVVVWRRSRGRVVGQTIARHRAGVVAVRAVPGRAGILSVARDGGLLLADLAAPVRRDGTPLVYAFAGATGPVHDLVVETSGRRALTVGAELAVWDLLERRVEPVARLESPAASSAVAGAGAWALTGGDDGSVRMWDLRADRGGVGAYALTDHGTDVVALALARRGTALASAGRDERVRVWRIDGDGVPTPRVSLTPTRAIERVALSEAGRWLAGSSGPFVFVWDLEQPGREPTELVGHAAAIRELTFAGDGWLVSADLAGEIHSWRFAAGGPEAQSRRTALPTSVWALATSAEHVAVGTGSRDESGRAYVWPLGEEWSEEARVAEHSRPVTALVFARDGERLASGSADGGVRPAALHEGQWRALAPYDHGQSVGALAFAGDGTLAIGGLGGTVAVVEPRAGGERRRFAAHAAAVTGMAFGTDSSRLVTASQGGELKLWRLGEEEREVALVGHTGGIFELQADRTGRVVATAADDSSVRVWPLEATGLLRMACLATGRDLTTDEWSRALPSHRAEALCAGSDGEW